MEMLSIKSSGRKVALIKSENDENMEVLKFESEIWMYQKRETTMEEEGELYRTFFKTCFSCADHYANCPGRDFTQCKKNIDVSV